MTYPKNTCPNYIPIKIVPYRTFLNYQEKKIPVENDIPQKYMPKLHTHKNSWQKLDTWKDSKIQNFEPQKIV